MEPLSTVTILALVSSTVAATVSLIRMYFSYTSFNKIKLTRKDTGKTITISTKQSNNNNRKLLEFVD